MFTKTAETPRKTRAQPQEENHPHSGKKPARKGDRFGIQQCIGIKDKGEKEKREYVQQGKQSHVERAGREWVRREI